MTAETPSASSIGSVAVFGLHMVKSSQFTRNVVCLLKSNTTKLDTSLGPLSEHVAPSGHLSQKNLFLLLTGQDLLNLLNKDFFFS